MEKESVITPITRFNRVYYDTYANLPTTNLRAGVAGYATDRKTLYRWSGVAWESIGISSRNGNVAAIGNPADYPQNSLYHADDEGKLYMQISGAWSAIVVPGGTCVGKETNDLKNSNDTEQSVVSLSYVKLKEIKFNEVFNGAMRVKFDMKGGAAGTDFYGQIYLNGSPIGVEKSDVGNVYVTFTDDLSGLTIAVDDLLQIYCKTTDAGHTIYVKNMRLYYNGIITVVAGYTLVTELLAVKAAASVTNQDP